MDRSEAEEVEVEDDTPLEVVSVDQIIPQGVKEGSHLILSGDQNRVPEIGWVQAGILTDLGMGLDLGRETGVGTITDPVLRLKVGMAVEVVGEWIVTGLKVVVGITIEEATVA
jgi:hypothetical protein